MLDKIKDIYAKKAKQAYHTVLHSVWEYMPFFICIFAMIFSLVTVSLTMKSAYASEKALAEESYDYHIIVSGLDEVGMTVIFNQKYSVFTNDRVYEIVDTVRHYSVESGTKTYDMYLRLLTGNKTYNFVESLTHKDTLKANRETFENNYRSVLFSEEHGEHVQISASPLYELEAKAAQYRWREFFCLLICAAIFSFILFFFYRIRVNNKRFIYGVYASFGADRRRLSGTSVLEMFVCAMFMLIPASVASALFCFFTIPDEYRIFKFSLSSVLVAIPFTLGAIFLAVYLPIKQASRSEPISLISSDDNSNLVSRPLRSAAFKRLSFPFGYERVSLLRFRRRLSFLLLSSVLLCSVFVSSVYASDLYRASVGTSACLSSDYTVTFPSSIPFSVMEDIEKLSGVENMRLSYAKNTAIDTESHLLVNKKDVRGNSLYTYPADESYTINDDFTYYSSANGGSAELLAATYDIEGDIYCVDANTVIIADTSDNRTAYDFQVGDTIQIGIYLGSKEEIAAKEEAEANGEEYIPPKKPVKEQDMFIATGDKRYDLLIETNAYEYITCTVGAVIHGYPSSLYGTPIILSDELFTRVTGETPEYTQAEIHLERGKTHNTAKIASSIRDILQEYPDASLEVGSKYFDAIISNTESYDILIKAASVVCIPIIPVMWLYSQILFYRRRQEEFDLLESLSAYYGDIRALHLADALILGSVALLALPLSFGCVKLIHHLYNYTIPTAFLSGANIIAEPHIPLSEYIAVTLCSALSAILASLLPYLLFRVTKRRQEYKQSLQLSEVKK